MECAAGAVGCEPHRQVVGCEPHGQVVGGVGIVEIMGAVGAVGGGEKEKTLLEFWDFDKVYLLIILILINMLDQTNFLLLGSL